MHDQCSCTVFKYRRRYRYFMGIHSEVIVIKAVTMHVMIYLVNLILCDKSLYGWVRDLRSVLYTFMSLLLHVPHCTISQLTYGNMKTTNNE